MLIFGAVTDARISTTSAAPTRSTQLYEDLKGKGSACLHIACMSSRGNRIHRRTHCAYCDRFTRTSACPRCWTHYCWDCRWTHIDDRRCVQFAPVGVSQEQLQAEHLRNVNQIVPAVPKVHLQQPQQPKASAPDPWAEAPQRPQASEPDPWTVAPEQPDPWSNAPQTAPIIPGPVLRYQPEEATPKHPP